jgi:Flp pilus assembly protein TadG
MRNRKRPICGQSFVEFALIAVVFLIIFLGIMDWSWTMFEHESLTSQASRAARYAAVHDMTTAATVTAAKNIALTPSFGLTAGNVSVTTQASSYTGKNGMAVNVTQVLVTISGYTVNHWFFGNSFAGRTITATALYEYCTDP